MHLNPDTFNLPQNSDLSEKLQKLKPYGAADRKSPSEKAEERSKLIATPENNEKRTIKDGEVNSKSNSIYVDSIVWEKNYIF